MTLKQGDEPEFSIRDQTVVNIRADKVEHALRCFLAHIMAGISGVPHPKNFSEISVSVSVSDDGKLLGAALTYEPDTNKPRWFEEPQPYDVRTGEKS